MESVSNDDDSTTRNTTITGTKTEPSHEKENQHHLDHCNDHCHLIHQHDIDGNPDELNKVCDDIIEDVECVCPICLRTATEIYGIGSTITTTTTTTTTTTASSLMSNGELRSVAAITSSSNSENNDIEFVYSSTCKHIYCFPCIEQILLHSSSSSSVKRTTNTRVIELDTTNNNDNIDHSTPIDPVITMTQGVCPICRAELSYFDLKKVHIHIDENNNGTKVDNTTLKYKTIRSDELIVPKVDTTTLPKELYGVKYQSSDDVSTHMLAIQFPNCLFESETSSNIGIGTTGNIKLYDGIDVDDFYKNIQLCFITKNDDGKEELQSYMTMKEYQYLSSTQTFKGSGTMYVKSTDDDGNRDDYMMIQCVWMTFSENFQFVTHGVSRVAQRTVVCTTCLACHPRIDGGTVFISAYGGDSSDQLIRIITNPTGNITPPPPVPGKPIRYKNSTIWGNVYCQELSVGFASFHFIRSPKVGKKNHDDGMAYISYEHPKSAKYIPLDDGRPLPSRVLFRNITCPNPNTFCGSIRWEVDYGTTWHGSSRWDFIIKFDNKFMCIISGTVHSVTTNRKTIENSEPQLEEISKLEYTFGEDLNYVNAGLHDSFIEKMILKYGDEFRWMKESDDPKRLFLMMMNDTIQKITSISDRLAAQRVPSFIIRMVTYILQAATVNSHHKLSLIIKDVPHSKAKDILEMSTQLEKNLMKNPIDFQYHYE